MEPTPRYATGQWRVERLRMSAFQIAPPDIEAAKHWFAECVGVPSDSQTIQRGTILDEIGAIGPDGAGHLALHFEPARTDWRLVATAQSPDSHDVNLGELAAGLRIFVPVVERWLEGGAPPCRRMAFGANLYIQVESPDDGIELLGELIPGLPFRTGDADVLFQVNRRRDSHVTATLRINRLSKWSITSMQKIEIVLSGDAPIARTGPDVSALRVQLDINSDADWREELPQPLALFRELINLGAKMLDEGDLP